MAEVNLDSATDWAGTAWDVVVDFFDQARIIDLWQWLLTNPAAVELGNLTGILWTALTWNLMFLLIFALVGKLQPRLKWLLLILYLFFSAGLFVLSQSTEAVVAATRAVPGQIWLGDQVLLVWLFIFLALFIVIVIVGHYVVVLGQVAWILNLVLLWVVYAIEWSIYGTEWSIWGLSVMGILTIAWIVANMIPSGAK